MSKPNKSTANKLIKHNKDVNDLIRNPIIHVINPNEFRITDEVYEEYLKPLHDWLVKLKILGKPMFNIWIYKYNYSIAIELRVESKDNKDNSKIEICIPGNAKNIILGQNITYKRRVSVKIVNAESLIIDEYSYKHLLRMIAAERLYPNLGIYTRIEQVMLKDLEIFIKELKTADEEDLVDLDIKYGSLKINQIIYLIRTHNSLIGEKLSSEDTAEMYNTLKIVNKSNNIADKRGLSEPESLIKLINIIIKNLGELINYKNKGEPKKT